MTYCISLDGDRIHARPRQGAWSYRAAIASRSFSAIKQTFSPMSASGGEADAGRHASLTDLASKMTNADILGTEGFRDSD